MSLFSKPKPPLSDAMRETLFGDMPLAKWPADPALATWSPWSSFVTARNRLAAGDKAAAIACWNEVLEQQDIETRHYLQAWHFLRQQGEEPREDMSKQVLGVIVEVEMPKGLDILAAYADYSVRYYNFSGAAVIWEHPDDSLDPLVDTLFEVAKPVVVEIDPWNEERPPTPEHGSARLSFLTPSGLHFGDGPMDVLANDPLGGRVFFAATDLMQALLAKPFPFQPDASP